MTSKFSAANSAIGYFYQARVALWLSLGRLKNGSDFFVSLETLDDVTFETHGGEPQDLLQTKHHRNREAALTDASQDLWKSLRVWFERSRTSTIASSISLYLLTTGTAPTNSISSYLRRDAHRDVDAALKRLESVAGSSANSANTPAYDIFLKTPETARKQLIESVFVIDAAPMISDLDTEIRSEVFWAVDRKYQDSFLEHLEGWWFRRVLKQLTSASAGDRIIGTEIEAQMSDLRDQFRADSLPIDADLLSFDLDEATQAAFASARFVRQLELITVGKKRVVAAIRDYHRAFEQRSRWLRDELLFVGELGQYEKRLLEEWELVFEAVRDELGEEAAEESKQKAAREVLKWAERESLPIRTGVTEPFVTRGSLHILSDELRLGWHPEFRDRLATLLVSKGNAR